MLNYQKRKDEKLKIKFCTFILHIINKIAKKTIIKYINGVRGYVYICNPLDCYRRLENENE